MWNLETDLLAPKPYMILSLCILLCTACADTRTTEWEDGSLRSSITYLNNEIHGNATWYFRNGNKREEFNYQRGILEGIATRWYYNGQRQSEDVYVNGRRSGVSRSWTEEGVLVKAEEFLQDTLHGDFQQFHPNGIPMVQGRYHKGLYDGIWIYQDQRGIMVGEGRYVKGTGELRAFDMAGKVTRIVGYSNNEKDGSEVWFSPQGDSARIMHYSAGRLIHEEVRDPNVRGSWNEK